MAKKVESKTAEAKTVKVKPNPDKTVNGRAVQVDHPFHTGRKINVKGEEIRECNFITRRLSDGDLVRCDGKGAKSEPAHQEKKKDIE